MLHNIGVCGLRLALSVLVAVLGGFVLLRAQESPTKKPIPDPSSLQQALALVEEVYGDEFKRAKDVAQRTALAEKLLQKAKESAADPTGQFALLRVARDIAALAGDADLALRAVDEMAATFQIETFPVGRDRLSAARNGVNASTTTSYDRDFCELGDGK